MSSQGQRYWDEKMPLYYEIKELRNQRKQEYIKEAKKCYPVLEEITNDEYCQIRDAFLNGDEKARGRLMEVSILPIINALAGIYAKYDIEEVVPFEEGLSYVLEKFMENLKSFNNLPKRWCEYSISIVNFYIFNRINFFHNITKYHKENVEVMPQASITWEIDQKEYEDFSYKSFVEEEVRTRIIKVMSKLETRQARVLALKYGLFDGIERTFEEISESEGNICRSRAEQIAKAGLMHIRRPKVAKHLRVYADADLDLIN